MVRSKAVRAKIARGVKRYHGACKKAMGGKKLRSMRGRGPGRKGPSSKTRKDGGPDRRFTKSSAVPRIQRLANMYT